MLKTKRKRIRITRGEIEKAKQSLGQEKQPRHKEAPKPQTPRGFWRDGIYCDPFGRAWDVDANLDSVCLGRIDEVTKGENSFPRTNDSHSCHLRVKNADTPMSDGGTKSIVATFKKDPCFLGLLVHLISSGLGIRAIHSELKAKGYEIPLRTLGRWVKQQKAK
jgi:hypothetical protein